MTRFESLSKFSRVHANGSRMTTSNLLLVVVGAALFAWVLVHAGPSAIVQQLKALRVALPIVVVLSLVRLQLQTLSWSAALKNEGIEISMPRLMGIRMA